MRQARIVSVNMMDPDGNHFLTNIDAPQSPKPELGHQKTSPLWNVIAYSVSRGFLGHTVLRILLPQSDAITRAKLASGTALMIAADDFVNMEASELSYEHEFAREEWEHEFNAIGEIDEYVAYAISRGVPAPRARELALILTSEPRVSIPYHLAFELGLLEPPTFRKELIYASLSGVSHLFGALASEGLFGFMGLAFAKSGYKQLSNQLAINIACALGVMPQLAYRFREVSRVKGSRRFEITSFIVYAGFLGATILLGRIWKQ